MGHDPHRTMNRTTMHTALELAHRVEDLEIALLRAVPYVQLVECLQAPLSEKA